MSPYPAITVDLHGLKLAFRSPAAALRDRFEEVYGHLPRPASPGEDLVATWRLQPEAPAPLPSPELPLISAEERISYYGTEAFVTIRMPKYALMEVDLKQRAVNGVVTPNCLEAYGAFEDVLMIALAPLYRRRGWFPLHAFAALSPGGQAALISGRMGAGKTTTGLALLQAGWKLLSNDSPLLALPEGRVRVLAYPGRLSAFDDSLARFENLKRFIPPESDPRQTEPIKRVFRAEAAFEAPWAGAGPAGGIFLPCVTPGLARSELVPVTAGAAVVELMPQAIEGWDKATMGQNLRLLSRLAEQAPAYTLRLSPLLEELPGLMAAGMEK